MGEERIGAELEATHPCQSENTYFREVRSQKVCSKGRTQLDARKSRGGQEGGRLIHP